MKVNIRINLLPPEFRSAGVDPKLKLILGASGLAAVGLLLFTWLYLVFSTSSLGDELESRQQDVFACKKEAVQVGKGQEFPTGGEDLLYGVQQLILQGPAKTRPGQSANDSITSFHACTFQVTGRIDG